MPSPWNGLKLAEEVAATVIAVVEPAAEALCSVPAPAATSAPTTRPEVTVVLRLNRGMGRFPFVGLIQKRPWETGISRDAESS